MTKFLVSVSICLLALAPLHAKAEVKSFNEGAWEFGCQSDSKSPYGDVLSPRHCWMRTNRNVKEEFWAEIIVIQDGRVRRPPAHRDELCDPIYPDKNAIDGVKVDGLYETDDEGYVKAVLNGKHIVYQAWKHLWPECDYKDVEADLSGTKKIFKKIVEMAPTYDIAVPEWAKALAADSGSAKK